jgi:hypothetical protein
VGFTFRKHKSVVIKTRRLPRFCFVCDRIGDMSLYAIATPANTYHVLSDSTGLTLCGRSVFVMDDSLRNSPPRRTPLHRTFDKPEDRPLCLKCADVQREPVGHCPLNHPTADQSRRIYYATLDKLCVALNCGPGDLLVGCRAVGDLRTARDV